MNAIHTRPASLLRTTAIASALLCCGIAQAQSTVTIYGLVDAGVTRVSGLRAGTVTQVASGIMEGSRWGLRGNEDLGGGYRAIFTLENRFEADTGTVSNRPISGSQLPDRLSTVSGLGLNPALPGVNALVAGAANAIGGQAGVNLNNAYFDRQIFLGLITPVGAVLAGRQYTPAFEIQGTYDIMQTQSGLAAGQIVSVPAAVDIRVSNALAYRIQTGGITASVMYGFGEVAGDTSKSRLVGFQANYKSDAFSVGLGYNTRNNELGAKSLTSTVLGASTPVAGGTLSTLLANIKDENPTGLSTLATQLGGSATAIAIQNAYINGFKQDGNLMHIGYRYITGPNTISVAYTRFNDKTAANADVASYGVAYSYALSKRTDLNAVLVRYANKNTAQVAPGGNGYLGGVTGRAGQDSTGLAFGIRHRF